MRKLRELAEREIGRREKGKLEDEDAEGRWSCRGESAVFISVDKRRGGLLRRLLQCNCH
jgi:hypothetical protein